MKFLVALIAIFSFKTQAEIKGYRCLGTEPFFSLKITGQQLKLESPDGPLSDISVTGPITPHGMGDGFVSVYKSKEEDVNVSIVYGSCTDGMSDTVYAYHMVYVKDEYALYGCCEPLAQD